MSDLGNLFVGIAAILAFASGVFFSASVRRQAHKVADAQDAVKATQEALKATAAEKSAEIDMLGAAQASMKQSLDWSDADRLWLRTELVKVTARLEEVQLQQTAERIQCAVEIGKLEQRIVELERR